MFFLTGMAFRCSFCCWLCVSSSVEKKKVDLLFSLLFSRPVLTRCSALWQKKVAWYYLGSWGTCLSFKLIRGHTRNFQRAVTYWTLLLGQKKNPKVGLFKDKSDQELETGRVREPGEVISENKCGNEYFQDTWSPLWLAWGMWLECVGIT